VSSVGSTTSHRGGPGTPQRVAIVTGEDAPDLTDDGTRLREQLQASGFAAEPVRWRDRTVDWEQFDAALVRSCWNYYTEPERFRRWIDTVERAGTTLLNPPAVIRWNMHKSYLQDLASRGIPIVPTELIETPHERSLAAILHDRGWQEAVVKPVVGTSAAGAWKTTIQAADADQARFEEPFRAARRSGSAQPDPDADERLSERGALVQQFVPEVADGERSLVFFGGEFSHAWQRLSAPAEFGLTPNFDESQKRIDPSEDELGRATDALETAASILGIDRRSLPYARVDCVEREGEFLLMELELIEPYLKLGVAEGAVTRFATAVEAAVANGSSD
jgi:hypothetical protein